MGYELDGKAYEDKVFDRDKHDIFVFGSNEGGIHGAGAAWFARKNHGAQWGVGVGRTGSSYAIPTKNNGMQVLPLSEIYEYVKDFIAYARANPDLRFFVTRIGCGLAGYKDHEVRPLFHDAPSNCDLPEGWRP